MNKSKTVTVINIILFIKNYFLIFFAPLSQFCKNTQWELIWSANNFFSFSVKSNETKNLEKLSFHKENCAYGSTNASKKAWFEHLSSLCKMGIQKTQSYSLYQQWSLKWGVSIPRGSFWFSTYVVKHPKVVFLYCNLSL